MKTYEPRRNNACPNGLHPDYNPELDPSQNECTCPWLIIQSSSPVQHLTSWNRRELDNAIREFDNGYFDPPGYPRRERSMFLSASMQRLLDVAQAQPVAAALTLLAGSGSGLPPFDAIAWDAEDAALSVRIGGGGWWHLFLGTSNVEAVTNHDDARPAGANPVLLWADHPDTWHEIDLPPAPGTTPHEMSGDVFAEDFASDPHAGGTDAVPPLPQGPFVVEVSASEIDSLRPGNPVYDDLLRQAQEASADGVVFLPAELASGGVISQGMAVVVGEDGPPPSVLPRRVPQVPSDIAQAGHGDYCTCDLNLRYTCPLCRDALDQVRQVEGALSRTAEAGVIGDESSCPDCGQFLTAAEILGDMTTHDCALPDRTCVCDIRGSAPDTYNCPEHGPDTM